VKPVFIHISKNAGTSIVKSARRAISVAGHRTAASWISENGHDAPLFAVIRNPFDRVVSEYFYRKRRYYAGEKNPHLANLHKSFEEWVTETFRGDEYRTRAFFERTGIRFNQKNMVGNTLIWFLTQRQWIASTSGEILVDHILRHEHLDRDWTCFTKKYRIQRSLGVHNPSRRDENYQQYYSPQTRKIIEDYFQDDLDYQFQ
jgi:hypothetical protein